MWLQPAQILFQPLVHEGAFIFWAIIWLADKGFCLCLLQLAGQMEHFPNPLDLFNAFTRLRAHGKHLQRPGDTLEVIGRTLYLHMKTDQSDLLASRYAPQCSTELLPKSIRSQKKKLFSVFFFFQLCSEEKYSLLGFFALISSTRRRLKCCHCSRSANICSSSCWVFATHCGCFHPVVLLVSAACLSASWLVIERSPPTLQHVYLRSPRRTS